MTRLLSILLVVGFVLLLALGAFTYFGYGVPTAPPARASVPGLEGDVTVTWTFDDFAVIAAASEADAYAGLGFVHGQAHPWSVALWRQAAQGRLGEWFGGALLPVDRLARRLGFAALAESTYAALPDADRRLLDAYAAGLEAALSRRGRHDASLAVLGLDLEPWQPSDALALERLFAWLHTPPLDTLPDPATPEIEAFVRADALLRDLLHLHGFGHHAAWTASDSAGTGLYQRHVPGASALRYLQEVTLLGPDSAATHLATVPGMPFAPAGRSPSHAWAYLPRGEPVWRQTPPDSTLRPRYERLLDTESVEHLFSYRRRPGSVVFEPAGQIPADRLDLPDTLRLGDPGYTALLDSARAAASRSWSLEWAGLRPGSDFGAWRALERGQTPAFRLAPGGGLRLGSTGEVTVLGRPAVQVRHASGVLVAADPLSRYLAVRMDTLAIRDVPLDRWIDDVRSPWAERLAPALIASVDSLTRVTPEVEEPLTFLRNWDFSYDRASIGASIFDRWVAAYRDLAGDLPDPSARDTLGDENIRRYTALQRAVRALRDEMGDDLSQWRWERVYDFPQRYPVWSADTLLARTRPGLGRTRFSPVEVSERGHPTTLAWGPSPILEERIAPSAWVAWVRTDAWDRFYVRRRAFDLGAFMGRFRTARRQAPTVQYPLAPDAERQTTLRPAS